MNKIYLISKKRNNWRRGWYRWYTKIL